LPVTARRVWRKRTREPDTERAELQPHRDGKQRKFAAFHSSGADRPVISTHLVRRQDN
jgi:hypothetical protein